MLLFVEACLKLSCLLFSSKVVYLVRGRSSIISSGWGDGGLNQNDDNDDAFSGLGSLGLK